MIGLKNVSKSYGAQKVLEGFDLVLEDGSRTALMGRSGAGKTTVLRLIMGLIKPDSGEVILPDGIKIGAVFQEDRLIGPLGAEANCRVVMQKGEGGISELLGRLGIGEELRSKPVSELSGGERRRVAIARALLFRPSLILLDEPFKGIDRETLPSVIGAVSEAAEGRTLLLVTHSAEEAEALNCKIVNI